MPVGLANALGVVRLGELIELTPGLGLIGVVSELVVSELVVSELDVSGLVVTGGKRLPVVAELAGLRSELLVVVVEDGLDEDVPSDEVPKPAVGAGANNGEFAGLVCVAVNGVVRGVLNEDVLERPLPLRLLPPRFALEFPV